VTFGHCEQTFGHCEQLLGSTRHILFSELLKEVSPALTLRILWEAKELVAVRFALYGVEQVLATLAPKASAPTVRAQLSGIWAARALLGEVHRFGGGMGDEDDGGHELEAVIARRIERYQPRSPRAKAYWWRTAEFVRRVVRTADPKTEAAAYMWLRATSDFIAWCLSEGYELSAEVMFTEPKVERYILVGISALDMKTKAEFRAALHQVGRRVTRRAPWQPLPVDLGRRKPLAPYSASELDLVLKALSVQATDIRQRAGLAVAAFIYGAGLQTEEMFYVTASDVRRLGNTYVVQVSGVRRRTVPILPKARPCVRELLELGIEEPLVSERRGHRRTIAGALVEMLEMPPKAPTLSFNRLRTTWLVTVARAGLRISEVVHLAGSSSASFLTPLLAHFGLRDFETVAALIGDVDGDDDLENSW
jgi:hypothetical protein